MPEAPKPSPREVASGVANLGNTCYMNAVLQALAHAPELCTAMDVEPHRVHCPTALSNAEKRRNSPSPPEETTRKRTLRKSRRSGKKSPTSDLADGSELQFCALCEIENHIESVHSGAAAAVAPTTFVNGFIDQVAPWFKLGVQEDSHEFLRLLIDAMQKSCARARKEEDKKSNKSSDEEQEYPFSLFRGAMESNVRCGSCEASSSKIDPFEDIGLEVSTISPSSSALGDLLSSFHRFIREEPLDSGYKCDKCGNMGKATKQSRLSSIPPILTLHLKRFRYGSDGKPIPPPPRRGREVSQLLGSSGSAKIEGHIRFLEIFDLKPFMTEDLANDHKSMFCRLFAVIVHAGKNSHSGHYYAYVRNLGKNEWWRMDDARVTRASSAEVLSAEAYMLFYRVVEHPVTQQLKAKAQQMQQEQAPKKEQQPEPPVVPTTTEPESNTRPPQEKPPVPVSPTTAPPVDTPDTDAAIPAPPPAPPAAASKDQTSDETRKETRKRKREPPKFETGEEWARAKTRLPPSLMSIIRKAEEFISENVEFKPEFFKTITEEALKGGKFGSGLISGVCDADVKDGSDRFRSGLIELIYRLATQTSTSGGISSFFRKDGKDDNGEVEKRSPDENNLIVPIVEANETFL